MALPAEIWSHIFDLAADEDIIFQYGLPTVMSESAWFRNFHAQWALRLPQEALNLIQLRSYATKKSVISTCKSWRSLGSEFLFRSLFFTKPSNLLTVRKILDASAATSTTANSSIGWWTRRFHLTHLYASDSRGTTLPELEAALIAIIKHCPHLEIFVVDWPMKAHFGKVADTLATTCKSLRSVHWNVPSEAMSKVIWALDSLPYIVSAHIEFEPMPEHSEMANLGAAGNIGLTLPSLQQLSLRGYFSQFVEHACEWSMPALRNVSFDSGTSRNDLPDAVGFLTQHGSSLVFLDLNCIPLLDVAKILDLCPALTTFTFNADWRIVPNDNVASVLVNSPHPSITAIGLHGLQYAFGVGFAKEYAAVDPLASQIIRHSNDLNVAALTKRNFPRLQVVRVLSRVVLTDLNAADGPADDYGGMDRWERWWAMFSRTSVRLEDCTGTLLGTLPDDNTSTSEDGSDTEIEDEDEEEEEDEWEIDIPPMEEDHGERTAELRQLLEECRAMSEGREESMFGAMMGGMPSFGMGGMNMNMGMGSR